MQKKLFILLPLIALYYHLSPSPFHLVHAASPKPSVNPSSDPTSPKPSASVPPAPSPSPASMNEITENLKKIIQDNGNDTNTNQSPTRAYVGTVRDVIKDTVVMEDKDGKKDVIIKDDTTIVRTPGNSPIKQDSIRIDDSIIAIGLPTDQNVLSGKRLIVSTTPFAPSNKSTGLGTVKTIGKNSITILSGDKTQDLDFSTKTLFKSAAGIMQLTDLSEGDTIIYTATTDSDGTTAASIIMRIKTSSL